MVQGDPSLSVTSMILTCILLGYVGFMVNGDWWRLSFRPFILNPHTNMEINGISQIHRFAQKLSAHEIQVFYSNLPPTTVSL